MISEELKLQLTSDRNLIENDYRYGSEKWGSLIREARRLYRMGILDDISLEDYQILESDIAELVGYNGEAVMLEVPYPIDDSKNSYFVFVLNTESVQKIYFDTDGEKTLIEECAE